MDRIIQKINNANSRIPKSVLFRFEQLFKYFSTVENRRKDGKFIKQFQSDLWMKLTHVMGDNRVTNVDTAVCFAKLSCQTLTMDEYDIFLFYLARLTNLDFGTMKKQMSFYDPSEKWEPTYDELLFDPEIQQRARHHVIVSSSSDQSGSSKSSSHSSIQSVSTPTPRIREAWMKAFLELFRTFSKFGDPKSDGTHITLSQSDKWMKQARVIDGTNITTTDTAIHFKKLKAIKVTLFEYHRFLNDLGRSKKVDVYTMKVRMSVCGPPELNQTSTPKITKTISRLTDPSKYTGTHKLRFDEEGKGKGLAGRRDSIDNVNSLSPQASGTLSDEPKKNNNKCYRNLFDVSI